MPLKAFFFHTCCWLTTFTDVCRQCAAICMVVQNMVWWINFATWWGFESYVLDEATKCIWDLTWLKPHDIRWAGIFISSVNSRIERGKLLFIKLTWNNSFNQVGHSIPRWRWLIERIKSYDMLIGRELLADISPVSNVLVLNFKVIVIKSLE